MTSPDSKKEQQLQQAPSTENIFPLDKDLVLEKTASQASSPADISVSGEEDPGAGIEFFVTNNEPEK